MVSLKPMSIETHSPAFPPLADQPNFAPSQGVSYLGEQSKEELEELEDELSSEELEDELSSE
jgi:hypothetical protein